MVRLTDLPEALAAHLLKLPLPAFDSIPFAGGPPLAERRVAIVSTAGLSRRDDRRFGLADVDYRVIAGDTPAAELVMSHVSVNYDRSGFQEDANVVFPLERLRELAADGVVGSVAQAHFSFMGALDPERMAPHATALAGHLHADRVDAVALFPV